MHKKFDNVAIEKKWQEKWKESGIYNVGDRDASKEKEYVLVELPYPSGNLHIGHWYAFAVPDIYVRYRRMTGKQVVYPMGFDAFGLPAENAAIKRDINPREWTESNIEFMKEQLGSMGASFSWDKTASTIDPDYYKWTQWMFTEFFKNNIAYRGTGTVNWCPSCNTVIANEQVLADDTCERCGSAIEKKEMPQWLLKITDYADRLLDDLETVDWPEHIKEAQRQWIGKSEGAEITFKLSTGDAVTVFTTRPDTLFGATYMVLAPEHPLISKYTNDHRGPTPMIHNIEEVVAYVSEAKKKDEQDRLDAGKEKTGVKLEGITAINPASGEEIPVYIADYVLASYGTGAIMAVPAHDERDFAFAKKFDIVIKPVIAKQIGERIKGAHYRLAASAMLENSEGKILVQTHNHERGTFHSLPGGGVDDGESIIEAAIREVTEETGYTDIEVQGLIGVFEYNFNSPEWGFDRRLENHVIHLKLKSDTNDGRTLGMRESETLGEDLWLEKSEAIKLLKNMDRFCGYGEGLVMETQIYTDLGILINSGEFDGMTSEEAKVAISEKVGGKMTSTYRLRDWSVGRQRYWGVPIPIVYDPEGNAHPIPEKHLPWTLPEDVDFKPTGEPPLAKSKELKERTEKIFGEGWTPEVETLDTFVDSSWYFLRYIDNQNNKEAIGKDAEKNWMPVDLYFGGAEHTTMHLLYSRFWQKALCDLGHLIEQEPYKKRINRGLILGPDGNKMSKSKGNVIDPDEQVKLVGADSVKMYLAFMGPYEGSNYPWDMGAIAGVRRFLERVYGLREHISESEPEEMTRLINKTIAKVGKDIPEYKFNTAISTLMVYINKAEKEGLINESYKKFLQTLAPFAPHLTEELWMNHELLHDSSDPEQSEGLADVEQSETGQKWTEWKISDSIHSQPWPNIDESLLKDETVTIGVQINGKMRGTIEVAPTANESDALKAIEENEVLKAKIGTVDPKKVIYVQGRILNIITQ